MKIGIISLYSDSSKMIGDECRDYFDKIEMINIKDVSVESSTKNLETLYNGKKLEIQKHGIDIPKTYVASTISSAKKILESVNYPVIVKIPSGTHGKGVMVADTFAAASSVLDTLEVFKQPYIMQLKD